MSDAKNHSTPLPQSQSLFTQANDNKEDACEYENPNASDELGESVLVDENESNEYIKDNDGLFSDVDKFCEDVANITRNGIGKVSVCECKDSKNLAASVKKLEYLVGKAVEVVAAKDHQICIL